MNVIFEFLGVEPIENVVTCMNFEIDKVIYFGYSETITEKKENTQRFLKEYCGVKEVDFYPLPHYDLQSILTTMRQEIEYEKRHGSDTYFDITGGESLILVAFGMLSKELETSMHIYDIPNVKLIELDEGADRCISKCVVKRRVEMNLSKYIEMFGGTINDYLHKDVKSMDDDEFAEDVDKIWAVVKAYPDYWNPFSDFLKGYMIPDDNLLVRKNAAEVVNDLRNTGTKLHTVRRLNEIIDALGEKGILTDIIHENGNYQFRFKNESIKECLWEGGSILEIHTYQKELRDSDDCQVGVHIDWDGIVHREQGRDVLNEIDVLSLRGYIPTFISCKSGKMDAHNTLNALYELDTIAKRFGGKYAAKALVTTQDVHSVYIERAEEMGIEVR